MVDYSMCRVAAHLAVLAVSVVEVLFLARFLRSSLIREYFAVVD